MEEEEMVIYKVESAFSLVLNFSLEWIFMTTL